MSFTKGRWVGVADSGVYLQNEHLDPDFTSPVFETGCNCCTSPELSQEDADLIAAAGTAATVLDELGYKGQACIDSLPGLMVLLPQVLDFLDDHVDNEALNLTIKLEAIRALTGGHRR